MVGFTTDKDESLIDEIISQAKDACVLEQISAINCSSFTDSLLPTHLESRFRNLKSFPPNRTTTPPPYITKAHTFSISNSTKSHNHSKGNDESFNFSSSEEDPKLQSGSLSSPSNSLDSSPVNGNSNEKKGSKSKSKSKHGSVSSPVKGNSNGLKAKSNIGSVSPTSGSGSDESSISSLFKSKLDESKRRKQKLKAGSFSSNSFIRSSPSPPRKAGCFWCSPKKDSSSSSSKKKKSKENWWDKSDDEFLSDLGSFSSKKQQKILKKAMKEEQKISLEAEKIVQWAKQASARMNVLDIDDDELSEH